MQFLMSGSFISPETCLKVVGANPLAGFKSERSSANDDYVQEFKVDWTRSKRLTLSPTTSEPPSLPLAMGPRACSFSWPCICIAPS